MSTLERLSQEHRSDFDCDAGPTYLSLDEAGPLLDALSSETAQSIVVELADDPATQTEVADRVDSSLQNVSYHLSKLADAGVVTVVGTRYSTKGREMDVYAPAVTSVVIGGSTSGRERDDGGA